MHKIPKCKSEIEIADGVSYSDLLAQKRGFEWRKLTNPSVRDNL